MGKKHKHGPRFQVGDIVLLRGEVRTVLEVIPGQGNVAKYKLSSVRGRGMTPIYSETYLSPIGRKGK